MRVEKRRWPYPYRWAFAITDDNDGASHEATRRVYEYCLERGITPTRLVWAHPAPHPQGHLHQLKASPGITLDDEDFARYCVELEGRGAEFGLHGASGGNNERPEIQRAFERFEATFQGSPRVYACHSLNADNLYWGEGQYRSRLGKLAVRYLVRKEQYSGEDPTSPYYWSDICREKVDYVRLYRTDDLDVLRHNPNMPYHQDDKPDVRFWFSAVAQDRPALQRIDREALDEVAGRDGALLLYGHSAQWAAGDDEAGESGLFPDVEDALTLVGESGDCWSTTTSALLDRLLAVKNVVIHRARTGLIIANPTEVQLSNFQIEAPPGARLYRRSGQVLVADDEGRMNLGTLEPGSSAALYFSAAMAEVGDPAGISRREQFGMMFEELKHVVWQRWRKRFGRAPIGRAWRPPGMEDVKGPLA